MKGTKNQHPALQFTGNWFIDAGILGFVNLMEEVYGWDLEELQKKIEKFLSKEIIYCFTYAFWYKVIRNTIERWLRKELFKKDLEKKGIEIRKIQEDIKKKFINFFNKVSSQAIEEIKKKEYDKIRQIIIDINQQVKSLIYKEFIEYKDVLKKSFSSNKKTILKHVQDIGIIAYNDFFTNLSIFNNASNKIGKEEEILEIFNRLVKDNIVKQKKKKGKKAKNEVLNPLDKSLSPFIYSSNDFANEYYGKPMTLDILKQLGIAFPSIFLLSVPFSFIRIFDKNYLFYAPELVFCYLTNKKLKVYLQKQKISTNKKNIFRITWEAIIDTLIEYKSFYSLENMYIIEFSGIQKQQIQNVEYIGIPKLQASILFEDKIRNVLNTQFEIGKEEGKEEGKEKGKDKNRDRNRDKTDGNKTIWLLEEFVKRTFVYDKLLKHTNWALKCGENPKFKASLYALAIDAKIKENAETSSKALFSNDFFREYKFLVDEIKETYSLLVSRAILISQLFENEEEKSKLAYPLFSALKKKNRISFVNTLLKKFTELSKKENLSSLIKFIFENIISNDVSWENYALALIIGILTSRGGENGGEIHEE